MARTPDPLYVACTRQTMRWGVPFEALFANVAVTTVFTTGIMGNPLYAGVGVAIHMVMREKSKKDPSFARLWHLFFQTKMRSLTSHIWGASRLQPTPTWGGGPDDVRVSL